MYSTMEEGSGSPADNPGGYYKNRRRYYRSRSRSRNRSRSQERGGRNRRNSRSKSRSRDYNNPRRSPDLYRDLINQDYQEDGRGERNYYRNALNERPRDRERERERDREQRERERDRDRGGDRRRDRVRDQYRKYSPPPSNSNYLEDISNDSHDSDDGHESSYFTQVPNNKIIVRGLAQHITEADISNDLMQYGLKPVSIRLIRKKKTGASRGFAFVEFNTEEEATRWMEYKQGILMLQDQQYRAVIQYSVPKEAPGSSRDKFSTDWYCGKCLVLNFKRRENCFKCYASREESEKGGEGSDEVSNILTKKIILRNLDALTNEEGVLSQMQEVVPTLVSKISKILICRDPLTSTSRGICYLSFDNLVDSMNTHNSLKALEPPLILDGREVLISYCVDGETQQNANNSKQQSSKSHHNSNNNSSHGQSNDMHSSYGHGNMSTSNYTLADVPRLAEYSASLYASNSAEHESYLKYYTQYYITQISEGQFSNLPTISQMSGTMVIGSAAGGGVAETSGAAVAQSAMQRKMQKFASNHPTTVQPAQFQTPKGNDGKKYPTPDISLYQYDETSGYYYDPMTGLYYDANSQYYYNNETNSYLYWDNDHSTYVSAPSNTVASNTTTSTSSLKAPPPPTISQAEVHSDSSQNAIDPKSEVDKKGDKKPDQKQDKVKVAKKIVKDMEKWAKQLNQKKDMMAQPQLLQAIRPDEIIGKAPLPKSDNGYADVGFSILEKKEKTGKFGIEIPVAKTTISKVAPNNLVSSYGSDSDNEQDDYRPPPASDKDYVDFEKLTCLLCKRAFQSQEILGKHLKISNLHKENLQKYNLSVRMSDPNNPASLSYRDRAKERRLKYGEDDSPPPNRSKERFQREMEKQKQVAMSTQSSSLAQTPIGENNVGNRLLQKMGWSEGQGLGRKNQGRTNIIEAESRSANAGLGSKTTAFGPGDDYKSYIKKMMKARYDSVN